jgi:hypothetical protein
MLTEALFPYLYVDHCLSSVYFTLSYASGFVPKTGTLKPFALQASLEPARITEAGTQLQRVKEEGMEEDRASQQDEVEKALQHADGALSEQDDAAKGVPAEQGQKKSAYFVEHDHAAAGNHKGGRVELGGDPEPETRPSAKVSSFEISFRSIAEHPRFEHKHGANCVPSHSEASPEKSSPPFSAGQAVGPSFVITRYGAKGDDTSGDAEHLRESSEKQSAGHKSRALKSPPQVHVADPVGENRTEPPALRRVRSHEGKDEISKQGEGGPGRTPRSSRSQGKSQMTEDPVESIPAAAKVEVWEAQKGAARKLVKEVDKDLVVESAEEDNAIPVSIFLPKHLPIVYPRAYAARGEKGEGRAGKRVHKLEAPDDTAMSPLKRSSGRMGIATGCANSDAGAAGSSSQKMAKSRRGRPTSRTGGIPGREALTRSIHM